MPPEQAQGKSHLIDGRSDLYAVGAVLFRCITGRYVHAFDSAQERLIAAMKDRAPSLATVVPNAPASIVALVDRALAFDMDARWPDASTMRSVVRQVFDELKAGPQEDREPPTLKAAPESVVFDIDEHSSIVVEVSFGEPGT